MSITIVIQGPTNYYKQILENISPNQNYIWSTWKDEPTDYIRAIENKMPVVLSEKPSINGVYNVNLQCLSTLNGIKSAKSDFIFKTRGDMIFSDVDRLITELSSKKEKLAFSHYVKAPLMFSDLFSFGKTEDSLEFWNYYESFPSSSPELSLSNNYRSRIYPSLSDDELLSKMFFFRNILIPQKFDIFWLKKKIWISDLGIENL